MQGDEPGARPDLAPTLLGATNPSLDAAGPAPVEHVRAVKSTIGGYVIDSVVGAGGMGVVYAATDPKLGRRVAIKVLRRTDEGATHQLRLRLLREARAMAKLSHPNVVTIYEADTDDGEIYFAMEFVEGRTLSSWLRERRDWREIVKILIGAGRGLEAAHAVGLIHRDFKPENVLIDTSGRARVSDFGIASNDDDHADDELLGMAAGPSAPLGLTKTGQLVGTPLYMSPEQCSARAIDARSDQFSFSLVLHEALYGQHAFSFTTLEELVSRIARGQRTPPPANVDVPDWLRRVVDRGLSVAPDDRFPSMGALVDELEQSLAASAPLRDQPAEALGLPDKPSIAVLPFDNLSGDPDQEHLADGVVESITAVLSRIRTFFVISRNSAFLYKGRARNARTIGRELGVAYILEGSVQRVASRIRITVQLIETANGVSLWADQYDGTIDEVFDLQDRITEHVAGALHPEIRHAEIERVRRKRPLELSAYDYTMRAMNHVWRLEKDEAARGLALLERALEIDSDYPLGLALKAWCLAQHAVYNWLDDHAALKAEAIVLADRAASRSTDDPLILTVLGAVHTFSRNYGVARIMLQRAISLDPNSAWAFSRLAWIEVYSDQPDEARALFEKSFRLSPLDPMNFNNYVGLASAMQVKGEDGAAADLFQRALQERPNALWIHRNLAPALYGAGRLEEARASTAAMRAAFPALTIRKYQEAMVFSARVLDRIADQLRALGLPEG